MSDFIEGRLSPSSLKLDLRNPRMPDKHFKNELETIKHLAERAEVGELVASISASGWLDYEPLIVLSRDTRTGDDNVVIEGNRRLAALRLLNDGKSAAALRFSLPAQRHEKSDPAEVRVWFVDSRNKARDFIGFKHINGPFKWDSFAKAKFATEWLDEEPDLDAVSLRLGDSNNTVARLVNGYRVLLQSEKYGFDREKVPGRLAFSHLYTGLARPSMRRYLNLPVATGVLPPDPVDEKNQHRLVEVVTWLFGQDKKNSLIKSQNPDLKRFLSVLENESAVEALRAGSSLGIAYEMVEDKAARFAEQLFDLYAKAKAVSSDVALYEGDPALVDVAANVLRTVRSIHGAMRDEAEARQAEQRGAENIGD